MSEAPLPVFVESHGLSVTTNGPRALVQTFSPPYKGSGVTLYEFVLPAEPAALQRVCDTLFNQPSGGALHYEPLLPFVLLSFVDISQLSAVDPPQSDTGWFHERDAVFWFLAVSTKNAIRGEAIVGVPLYAFVDQPQALMTGREVEGWPKEWSTVTMGTADGDPGPLAVSTVAFPSFGPTVQGVSREILRVTRAETGNSGTDAAQVFSTAKDLLHWLWNDLGAIGKLLRPSIVIDIVETIRAGAVPLAFLKQTRDVADGGRACYQSVVEVPMKGMNVSAGGVLPGRYTVSLADMASHPIVSDLGLDPAGLTAARGFWMKFDFVVERGTVVWDARS